MSDHEHGKADGPWQDDYGFDLPHLDPEDDPLWCEPDENPTEFFNHDEKPF